MRHLKHVLTVLACIACAGLLAAGAGVSAQDKTGLKGWELDGKYNKYYDANEYDSFKGRVERIIEIVPLPGMDPGVGILVRDQDGDLIEVHLGPKSFVNLDSIGLKKGDKVKVKGAWAEIEGKEVFIASKVKKSEYVQLKVRKSSDGTPWWTLSPEELKKEKEQQF